MPSMLPFIPVRVPRDRRGRHHRAEISLQRNSPYYAHTRARVRKLLMQIDYCMRYLPYPCRRWRRRRRRRRRSLRADVICSHTRAD